MARQSDNKQQTVLRKASGSPGSGLNTKADIFCDEGQAEDERQQGRTSCIVLHKAVFSSSAAGDLQDGVMLGAALTAVAFPVYA